MYFEPGKYIAAESGYLIVQVNTLKDNRGRLIAGTNSGFPQLIRPMFYDAYHHITVLNPNGNPKQGSEEVVDIVGPLCENSDKFAKQRVLPRSEVGDILVQHDTGAHCLAMSGNYNGWLRPQELLLHSDGSVELIRRTETVDDLFITLNFKPKILNRI